MRHTRGLCACPAATNDAHKAAGIAFAGAVQSEHCRLTSLNLAFNGLGVAAKAAIKQAMPAAHV